MNANSQTLLGALVSVGLFGGCMGTSVDFDSAPTDPSAAGAGGGASDDTDDPAAAGSGDNEGSGQVGAVEWIAFDTDEGGLNRDLYALRLDTGERRPLVTGEANEVHPAFSPDGKHLAFVSDSEDNVPQIFLMDLESSEVTRLTDGPRSAQRPAFSPDGERVGFRRDKSIYTIALDGSDERLLPNSETTSISGVPEDLGGPAFSSVDGWIVFDAYNEVRATTFDGDATHVIVSPTTARQSHPTVSPSGFTVVLEVTCGDGYISIWSVPFSGIDGFTCQGGRRLSPADETSHTHPAFGPGDRLVWDRGNGEGDLVLWEAGSSTELTSGVADDRNPTWVPVGADIP